MLTTSAPDNARLSPALAAMSRSGRSGCGPASGPSISMRRRAMSSSASVGLEVNVPSLWGDLSELRFETVDFVADCVCDLAAELDQ